MSVGCAHSQRGSDSELPKYEHVFQKPLAEALDVTRQLLEAKGYSFEQTEDPTQLVTEWKSPDKTHGRIDTYSRYLVTGIVLSPRQSVVRIFRMAHETATNDVEWRKHWWKVSSQWAEHYSDAFVQEVNLRPNSNDEKRLAMLRGVQHGIRDLDLEQALTLRLESAPSVEVVSGNIAQEKRPTAVRDSDFYLEGWKEEARAEGPCTETVQGLPGLLHPGLTLLIGEQLGSNEAPRTVGHVVCQAAQTGLAVVLGLSIPDTEQARIDAYLASPGAPADQDALLEGRFWSRPYQDGRSSRAIMELIDRVRALRTAGQRVTLVAYDTDLLRGSERDAAQAKLWTERRTAQPNEVHIVLSGNTHTRIAKGTEWDQGFTPMAHLMKDYPSLVVLEMSYAQGTRWGCDLDRNGKLACGLVGATPSPKVAAREGLSPHIRRLDVPASEGFQGLLYVGKISPSLPAILGPQEASTGPSLNLRPQPRTGGTPRPF
ncbi:MULTISPECIES: DUF1380 domain-containing protein [Corallococcus]|uniref:DUF1380 domain-containing protein n=1 Tax=Corallococcus TaxID=83461 RepID=UPI001F44725B|nr:MULTISPECIES: DUF1380 domain-containing protein [Corallococcus]